MSFDSPIVEYDCESTASKSNTVENENDKVKGADELIEGKAL
jgi:hypothetical protein